MNDDSEATPKRRPGASAEGRSARDARAERLAAALKSNLGRRKAAARARDAEPPAAPAEDKDG